MGCPSMSLGTGSGARGMDAAVGNNDLSRWYSTGNFFGGKKRFKSKKAGSKKLNKKKSRKFKKGGTKLPGTADSSFRIKSYKKGGKKYRNKTRQKGGM